MDSRVLREASAWSTYRRLLGYLRPYRLVALSVLASMVIDALALTAFVRLVQPMVDDLFNRHDQRTVMLLLAAIPAIFLVRAVGTFVTSYGMAYIGRGVVETMREQIMARYLSLPGTFFGREDAVATAMRTAGVSRLIHGHTHRPAIHTLTLDGGRAERIVLGDWYEQGSLLRIMEGSSTASLERIVGPPRPA